MRMRHLDEGLVWLAEVASTCGKISLYATRCYPLGRGRTNDRRSCAPPRLVPVSRKALHDLHKVVHTLALDATDAGQHAGIYVPGGFVVVAGQVPAQDVRRSGRIAVTSVPGPVPE
jgi:hypothetical protein